jgi:hypothetical protein
VKRILALAVICAVSCCLHAQVADTTVCDILKAPQSFNGKIVRVKATVVAAFDQFVVRDGDCGLANNNIWLSYPEGSKAKAGPAVMVRVQPARNFAGEVPAVQRTPVQLDKGNKEFKQFDSLLAATYNKGGMCLGCNRNEVTATLVGRLDGVEDATIRRDAAGKIIGFGGFGNMNAYSARLVLQSVSDVTAKQIDYSKTLAATKDDMSSSTTSIGSLKGAQGTVDTLDPDSLPGKQLKRALDAFGKRGEDNGVVINFGNAANEASAKDEVKGTKDSPDGLSYICTINTIRVSSDAETRTIVFAGEDVANLRAPIKGYDRAPLFYLANRALITTILDAVATKQKTLTMPGGYLIWNTAWPPAEGDRKLGDAVTGFITSEGLASK